LTIYQNWTPREEPARGNQESEKSCGSASGKPAEAAGFFI